MQKVRVRRNKPRSTVFATKDLVGARELILLKAGEVSASGHREEGEAAGHEEQRERMRGA